MLIKCNECKKQFKIPEDKLPDVSKFSIKCPNCGEKIVVYKKGEKHTLPKVSVEPEMHPPGSTVAFLLIPDENIFFNVKTSLEKRGFIISTAQDVDEAVAKLALNRYDMVVFLDNDRSKNILKEIDNWSGNIRRYINVIAIGDRTNTFDPNTEFILGINSYISIHDISQIDDLIENAIKRHQEFLTPWNYIKNEK